MAKHVQLHGIQAQRPHFTFQRPQGLLGKTMPAIGFVHQEVQDESRAYRCLRGVPASKDILVKSRAQVERYRRVPASLERRIMEHGKVLYGRG